MDEELNKWMKKWADVLDKPKEPAPETKVAPEAPVEPAAPAEGQAKNTENE